MYRPALGTLVPLKPGVTMYEGDKEDETKSILSKSVASRNGKRVSILVYKS